MTSRKSVVFKITMDVFAKTTEAKDDLRSFVWDFGQEYNQTITLEDLDEYVIGASLHPAQVRTEPGGRYCKKNIGHNCEDLRSQWIDLI